MVMYYNVFTKKKAKAALWFPSGTMDKSAKDIYKVAKNRRYVPKGDGSAIRYLTYYLNRGGSNIPAAKRKRIEHARRMLQRDNQSGPYSKSPPQRCKQSRYVRRKATASRVKKKSKRVVRRSKSRRR